MRLRHALTRAVFPALLLTAALTACSNGTETPAGKALTAAGQLAAAKAKADAASSVHLRMASSGIPETANGVLGVDGTGTKAPAFKGTLDARISGFEAKVEVVAVDGLLYLKLPFSAEFVPVDPKEYNAPDPAKLFTKEGGITSLMTATTNPVEGKRTQVGNEDLTTIKGRLPGADVLKLLNIGDAGKTYDVTYGITDPGGELRSVTVVGELHKGSGGASATSPTSPSATSTYVLTLDDYGAPVEISKP